ncbi:MAG: TIGR04222 domain-containing membrane protein [Sphingomonadaceae bacterium]|nr:TIGR04222 domain-containing membrane protein [Sphingomonadaceae bacterium]
MELFGSYTGWDFLLLYGGLLVAAAVASLWIPGWLRAEGRFSGALDPEELALLAGGRKRLAHSALADLYAAGALTHGGTGKLAVALHDVPAGVAGKQILRGGGIFDLSEALKRVGDRADDLEERLSAKGLLLDKGARLALRFLSVLPFLVLLALGWYRKEAGEALGEPTGYLTGLMVVALALALWRFATLSPLTRAGEDALERQRARNERLRSAPTGSEAGLAVALFGTGVLVGTPFEAVHALRPQGSGDAGGSGDSGGDSGCGGGGCGGGGCGGCGG